MSRWEWRGFNRRQMSGDKKYYFLRGTSPRGNGLCRVPLWLLRASFSLRRPLLAPPLAVQKGWEAGRAVNYQEGILIKFFIVAAWLQPGGPSCGPSADSTLPCFYFPFAYLNLWLEVIIRARIVKMKSCRLKKGDENVRERWKFSFSWN